MHQKLINVFQIFDSGTLSYFMFLFILGRGIFVLDSFSLHWLWGTSCILWFYFYVLSSLSLCTTCSCFQSGTSSSV